MFFEIVLVALAVSVGFMPLSPTLHKFMDYFDKKEVA